MPQGFLTSVNSAQFDPNTFPLIAGMLHLSNSSVQRMNPTTLAQALAGYFSRFGQANPVGSSGRLPGTPEMQVAQALGLSQQGISLLANEQQSLAIAFRQDRRIQQQLQALGPSFQALRNLQQGLDTAGSRIERVLINDLGKVAPGITSLVDVLNGDAAKLIDGVLAPANLAKVRAGLGELASFLGSARFQRDASEFWSTVKTLGAGLADLAQFLAKHFGIGTPSTPGDRGKAPALPRSLAHNYRENQSILAGQEAVRREYNGGNLALSFLKSPAAFSHQVLASPAVRAAFAHAEQRNGLLPGTLQADALAESNGDIFAVNHSARGPFQMVRSARESFLHGANPFDPSAAAPGEARQLADNLALARVLDPVGTALQHERMAKAANAMGGSAFAAFYEAEQRKHRANDFLVDLAHGTTVQRETAAAVRRYIRALPERADLTADARAGRIDAQSSPAWATRSAEAIANDAQTRYLAAVARNTAQPMRVHVTVQTPTSAQVTMQSAAAR